MTEASKSKRDLARKGLANALSTAPAVNSSQCDWIIGLIINAAADEALERLRPELRAAEPTTHPRDHVTPDILADVSVGVHDGPEPAGLVERVERIIDILQDSRNRGPHERINDATEALQELRRRLMAGGAEGKPMSKTGLSPSEIRELVVRSIPYPDHVRDEDLTGPGVFRFRWKDCCFEVSPSLDVDEIQGSFRCSETSVALLLGSLLKLWRDQSP